MARPQKNNADYFTHDADASTDEKLVYLEAEFGLQGYALYFKMLEVLTRADDFEIEWNPIQVKVLARKFNVDDNTLNGFIVAATIPEIKAFRIDNGRLYSPGLKKRFAPLVEKRKNDANRIREKREKQQKGDCRSDNRHSKVKESKEEYSKDIKGVVCVGGVWIDDLDKYLQMNLSISYHKWSKGHDLYMHTIQYFIDKNIGAEYKSPEDLRKHFGNTWMLKKQEQSAKRPGFIEQVHTHNDILKGYRNE